MQRTHLSCTSAIVMCVLFVIGASPALAQAFDDDNDDGGDWDFFLGLGVEYEPEYEGSDKHVAEFEPEFQIVWRNRLLISSEGIGAFIVQQENLNVFAAVGYDGGREESDSVYLRGLGNIDDSVALVFGAQYDLTPRIAATLDVERYLGGSEGTLATIGIQTQVPFGVVRGALLPTGATIDDVADENGLGFFGGVSATWADTNFNQSFFGINAAQSASSGLSQYTAGSGLKSANVEIGFVQPLGKGWGLTGTVGYSHLLGDAADSPVVRSKSATNAELAIGFEF